MRLAVTNRPGLERKPATVEVGSPVTHLGARPHLLETSRHRQLLTWTQVIFARIRMLQSGRLRVYLGYLAITLLITLAAMRLELL